MTPQKIHNLTDVGRKLRNILSKFENDARFEQKLRRVLCNSDYFHENIFIRLKKRLSFNGVITFPLVSMSLLSGIFLAMLFQFAALGTMQLTKTNNNSANKTIELPRGNNTASLVQNLYKEGTLQYSGEEKDGTRYYRLNTRDNRVVEVVDKKPYAINYFTINP